MIETLRFLYLLSALIYFSYLDVLYREVHNRPILWSYIGALMFLINDINNGYSMFVFATTMLFYLIFFNLFYKLNGIGGADIKIMWLIVMLYPGILPLVIMLIAYLVALVPSMYFKAKKINYGLPFVVFITSGFLLYRVI